MRRRTAKSAAAADSPEKTPARRSTRRGRKSESEAEETQTTTMDSDSANESAEEYSPKKTKRGGGRRGRGKSEDATPKPRSRRRLRGDDSALENVAEEENGANEGTVEPIPEEEPQMAIAPEPESKEEIAEPVETKTVEEVEPVDEKMSESPEKSPEREKPIEGPIETRQEEETSRPEASPEQPEKTKEAATPEQVDQESDQKHENEKSEPEEEEKVEKEHEKKKSIAMEVVEDDKTDDKIDNDKRREIEEGGGVEKKKKKKAAEQKEEDEEEEEEGEIGEGSRKGKLEQEEANESLQPEKPAGASRLDGRRPRLQPKQQLSQPGPDDDKKPRKRRWVSRTADTEQKKVIAISTDSLKGIIEDVKPVPLSDVKLDSSSSSSDTEEDRDEQKTIAKPVSSSSLPKESISDNSTADSRDSSKSPKQEQMEVVERPMLPMPPQREVKLMPLMALDVPAPAAPHTLGRKISIVDDDQATSSVKITQKPLTPPKYEANSILYITNLVRPFTVLQLKGLLARTGKIVENGFWIDKIKSKCYVQYQNEDEAVETRHALHGVRWPISNPKCLNVDFGSEADMQKAIQSTADEMGRSDVRDFRSGDRLDADERKKDAVRPIREWDVGKKENLEAERERERAREKERNNRDRDRELRDVNEDRNRVGRKRTEDREITRNRSLSPDLRLKLKKDNEPPVRLLDDLFRKTKTTPCIYWLPLTPEQIAVREEARRKSIAEHQKRLDELRQEREREEERRRQREKDRARDRDKERERNRSDDRRKDRGDDRRRYR